MDGGKQESAQAQSLGASDFSCSCDASGLPESGCCTPKARGLVCLLVCFNNNQNCAYV